MQAIEDIYAQETVQGAAKRWFEEVEKGDSLGLQAKGPLTVTDVICFHAGGYGFVPYAPTANRLAHKNRQRIPAFYIRSEERRVGKERVSTGRSRGGPVHSKKK